MRKILFVMFAALAFVACEKEPFVQANDFMERELSNKVSLNQALVYAENSINGIGTSTRSTSRKVKSSEIFVAKPSTRSAESEEVSFYLINYEDNEGFAMVSTDSRTTPVYAYSDEGNLTTMDLEINPLYKIFMDGAVPYYEYEIANYSTYGIGDRLPIELPDTLDDPRPTYVDGIFCYINTDTVSVSENAYITTLWHQKEPYNFCLRNDGNNYNNNYHMGCVPVAAAQIMAYHEWPASYGGYTFNYTTMKSEEVSTTDTPAAIQASRLMERFGVAANINYNANEENTGVSPERTRTTLVGFGYNCSSVEDFASYKVRYSINNELPVLMFGYDGQGDNPLGHAWVIDAYQYSYKMIKYYHSEFPYSLYKSDISEIATYFRCNPGWKDEIVPRPYLLSTNFDFGFGAVYNYNRKIIYDIEPNN